MQSVVIIAPRPYEAELRQRLHVSWRTYPRSGGGWIAELNGSRLYIHREDSAPLEQRERAGVEMMR